MLGAIPEKHPSTEAHRTKKKTKGPISTLKEEPTPPRGHAYLEKTIPKATGKTSVSY